MARHQLSTALGLDYTRLWDELRELFDRTRLPRHLLRRDRAQLIRLALRRRAQPMNLLARLTQLQALFTRVLTHRTHVEQSDLRRAPLHQLCSTLLLLLAIFLLRLTLHHNIALRASVSVAVFDRRLADERRLRVVLNKGEVAALPPHAAKAAQVMISDRAVARGAVGLLGRRALKRAESADRVEGDVLRLAASAPVACVDNPRQVALAILAERWWDKVHEDGRVWRRVGLVVDE